MDYTTPLAVGATVPVVSYAARYMRGASNTPSWTQTGMQAALGAASASVAPMVTGIVASKTGITSPIVEAVVSGGVASAVMIATGAPSAMAFAHAPVQAVAHIGGKTFANRWRANAVQAAMEVEQQSSPDSALVAAASLY